MYPTTADLMIGSVRECKAGEQSPEDEAWGGGENQCRLSAQERNLYNLGFVVESK